MGLFQHELVRFVIVGGTGAGLLFGLSYLFLRLGLPSFVSGLVAYGVAFATAYLLQRNWTFQGAGTHRRTLPRYLAVQVLCAALSGAATHLMADTLSYPPGVAAFVATGFVGAVSFVLSSRWVFRDQA